MLAIFAYTLKRLRSQILGWGISFGLITVYLMAIYNPMIEQQAEVVALFNAYGEVMLAFFGGGLDFLSPAGYLDFALFSYVPVIAGIFAVLIGSGLLATDEEKGRLDLLLAYPVSRSAIFWGRFLAFAAATVAILACTWLGFVAGLPLVDWDVSVLALALPHLSLLAVLLLFGAIALLLSLLLPSRTVAASVAGGLLVANYLITSLARINELLKPLDAVLPLKYYQGGSALDGLNILPFAVLLGATVLLAALAWLLFTRRDIRVSGEGSWKVPFSR